MTETPPIEVHANPAVPQIAAGIRQVALSAGIIAGAFGATALAGKANLVVTLAPQIATILVVVGPAIWGAAVWLGQLATRKQAKAAVVMADKLPDSVATLK